MQEKGYRLPIPRIRESGEGVADEKAETIEIRVALAAHQSILISLPQTYPDQSLSWVIADDLLTSEIGGKQTVPIVVNGSEVSPPNNGIWSNQPISEAVLPQLEGVQVVFIIDSPPINSRTRIRFLLQQLTLFPEAKYVFVDKSGPNVLSDSGFASLAVATSYAVCDVSFVEIAHFVQTNFDMDGSEAELIAYRLRKTFQKFKLPAHPTYFAGIPKGVLASLLQANRRSELIQLAVDGFLTFVVAHDRADVTLSRTTRSRFLRKLAVEIKLEKTNFTAAELILFTEDFSGRHDFDIRPLDFITSFEQKGLLHFENGYVKITLPFIESYLLAVELSSDPALALRYFNVAQADFDIATFDLYAEIGASPGVIKHVQNSLESFVTQVDISKPHLLLTEEVKPKILAHGGRLQTLKSKISNAAKAVREKRDESAEKQKFLDTHDRIREAAARKSDSVTESTPALKTEEQLLTDMARTWTIAANLLGSGAEHLEAGIKRKLATSLVVIASEIIQRWIKFVLTIDFAQLKVELKSGPALEQIQQLGQSVNEANNTIDSLVDLIEHTMLTNPLILTLYHLCETARQKVLATSVASVAPNEPMQAFIHAAWLSDIDAGKGGAPMKSAIRQMPQSIFLRSTAAAHFLMRAYWCHSDINHRLTLLDYAEEVMKPTDRNFDKGKMRRLIESADSEIDPLDEPTKLQDAM